MSDHEIKALREQRDAAMTFAQEQMKRAESFGHWHDIYQRENADGHQALQRMFEKLEKRGYRPGTYMSLVKPGKRSGLSREDHAVQCVKYRAALLKIEEIFDHLLEEIDKAATPPQE